MLENRKRQDDEERINADKMKRGSRGFALGTTGNHLTSSPMALTLSRLVNSGLRSIPQLSDIRSTRDKF